jgi:ankyrin repeat protein
VFLSRDAGLLEARDDMGNTPLLCAFGSRPCVVITSFYILYREVKLLLAAGADPFVWNAAGETVLMGVMRYDSDYSIKRFIIKVAEGMLSAADTTDDTAASDAHPRRHPKMRRLS